MKKMLALRGLLAGLLVAFPLACARGGEIIYENSAADRYNSNSIYSTLEYGDEIFLAGTSRTITDVLLEYYGDFVAQGDEMARFRIYRNDGPPHGQFQSPQPGTLLFQSEPFRVLGRTTADPATGFHVQGFNNLSVGALTVSNTPLSRLTWTIDFEGLSGTVGDRAALVVRTVPQVGSFFNDFWWNVGGRWQLYQIKDPLTGALINANYGIKIIAVPEPATVLYALVGAGGLLLARRLRSKSAGK